MWFLLVVLMLVGCENSEIVRECSEKLGLKQLKIKPKNVNKMGAGQSSIRGLFFAKEIGAADKVLLERNVQNALELTLITNRCSADSSQGQGCEWNGITVDGLIEIGEKFVMHGYACREFTQTFFFRDKMFVVTTKACRIYLNDDGSGYWVQEDMI